MMLAYNIWTWTAIAALVFGSIAVFVVFLVTTWRRLRAERKPDAAARSQENPPAP
jgi:TRAP-type C4-dicarboxylate transport system permease small subunit